MINYSDFEKVDLRVGTIIKCELNKNAKKSAYKLKIDFGSLGIKSSSAQLTELYSIEDLINRQVVCVVNMPPKQVANVISEVLILGTNSNKGTVLLSISEIVDNGDKIW